MAIAAQQLHVLRSPKPLDASLHPLRRCSAVHRRRLCALAASCRAARCPHRKTGGNAWSWRLSLLCGSARGPGGLRARLSRHFRKEKRLHWHVDQLTAVAAIKGVWIAEGGDECALNAALGALPTPLPGFGSSDCPRCVAHLRRIPAGARLPSAWENARKTAESLFPSLRVTAE